MRALLVIALSACSTTAPPELEPRCQVAGECPLLPLEDHPFVAHAGGSPLGLAGEPPYTNSRQAFEVSLANGFRVFELDFLTLGDGTVVAAHDNHEDHYGLDVHFTQASRADLEGRRYDGAYDLLFAEDVIELMVVHPDIWVIIDSKWDHAAIDQALVDMSPDDSVRDRLVPHVGRAEADAQMAVYPWREALHATYQWPGSDGEIIDRMFDYGIDNVMMWWNVRWTEDFQGELDDAGLHTWVHTPDDPDVIREFLDAGVRIYSDGYIVHD